MEDLKMELIRKILGAQRFKKKKIGINHFKQFQSNFIVKGLK